MNSETKTCQNCKNPFTIEPDDFAFYEKISAQGGSASGGKVPPPTFCPECRLQRRLAVRNERNLYHRECGLCKKSIISMYAPGEPFPVYCSPCWWSDKWDPMQYRADYDWEQPFFRQFRSLLERTPRPALIVSNVRDCDYCNYFADGKECYLCFGSIAVESCLYGSPYESRYCVDTYLARECEYCYECIDCEKLSNSFYAQDCSNSLNLIYCFDCKGCQDCIGCAGLRNKKYHIFNKPYSKEEYMIQREKFLADGAGGFNEIKRKFQTVKSAVPHRFSTILQSSAVTGDHIIHSKNARKCFDVKRCEDTSYCIRMIDGKEVHDTNYCEFMEFCYEYIGFWKTSRTKFSNTCGESNDLAYSDFCSGSSNLFGCIGLRSKSYCILNKQYTKEEYEALVPKIIAHMNEVPYVDAKGRTYAYGEFFPIDLSPFAYNETIAQEYFPLTKEEALTQGYRWRDPDTRNYQITKPSQALPNHIKDVSDDILNEVIGCARSNPDLPAGKAGALRGRGPDLETSGCTTAFKIIPSELAFYRHGNLPLPRLCPNCRHYERLAQRNPLKLWHRACHCAGEKSENGVYMNTGAHPSHAKGKHCSNEFETSYAPDRPEIVYCEQCYQSEVA